MDTRRSFGSDNHAGIHPEVLDAVAAANSGHQPAYGDDDMTRQFEARVRELFGSAACAFPVWSGTGANVLGLAGLVRPYEAVICAETAHINTDECGAAEQLYGIKLLTVPSADGKLTPDAMASRLGGRGDEHVAQPKVVSITQATELGTCYSTGEIRTLAEFAHEQGLYLHLDGARLANAAASQGCELSALTAAPGVDVFSLGGTKNGAMGAEAIVAREELAGALRFFRKQGTQLSSKMRFVSAQLCALLSNDLWRRNAEHANAMARRLADGAGTLPGVRITHPVEANAVFAALAPEHIAKLRELWSFHVWDEVSNQVRWMASFDTIPDDVDAFLADLSGIANG